jgi:hypothetical protein
MALPQDERLIRLRLLARQLEATPPSPQRDELLSRIRQRIYDTEARDELGPPSSIPARAEEA